MKQTGRRLNFMPLTLLVLLAMFFVPGSASSSQRVQSAGPPEAVLDWPVDGEYLAEQLEVLAHAYDPGGKGIAEVQLFVNGQLVGPGKLEGVSLLVKATQLWPADEPPEPGEYLVEVRAVNRDGISSEPASAKITIVEEEVEISFTADQTTVKYGDCTTLRWTVENAESVELDGESVDAEGSREVCPTEPTSTYVLTVQTSGGKTAQEKVNLTVPPTPEPPPGVEISFEADQSTFKKYGDPITLKWVVKHAQSVQLNGESVPLQGSEQVTPLEPTNTYILEVVSLEGEAYERKITITVPATPTPTPPPISINFTADQTTLLSLGECTTLRWTVSNAQTVRLDGETVASEGSKRVCPPSLTNNYRLTAVAASGKSTEKTVTINVTPQAQLSLSADQTTLTQGQCTTLRWQAQDVQAAYLNGGQFSNTPVSGTGSQQICPNSTTTYVLTANLLGGGSDSRSATVSVGTPPPPPTATGVPAGPIDIQFWADSEQIYAGYCTTLHWHVLGVSAYYVDGEPGAGDDGQKQVCPCETETHTLQVVKKDGSTEDRHVTIYVEGYCEEPEPSEPYDDDY
jgi:uncharacterized Zn-binding protein involved in type VI secretion